MSAAAAVKATMGWTERAGGLVFSGHESFACRYGWLPKLHAAILADPDIFSSDERAIIALGLGRNMVKSIRFWGDAFGMIRPEGRSMAVTETARRLLDPSIGLDPHLETPASLWRLHWLITVHGGLGAWAIAFLDTHDPEITRDALFATVRARAIGARGSISPGTAAAHIDMLLRTYDFAETDDAPEEALGSPFQELRLIRTAASGGIPTVRFRRGRQPGLDTSAMAFVLHDFWRGTAGGSRTISMRSLMVAHGSPGAVLMLDEASLHERLDDLCASTRSLVLRGDGAGGTDVVASVDPLPELEKLAW